jgi:UPF0176 protein
MSGVKIAALYKFAKVEDPPALKQKLREMTSKHNILGMLILATEGINGTIASNEEDLMTFLAEFQEDPKFQGLELKFSHNEIQPFYRMRISIRKEIVTLGIPEFHIEPSERIHNVEPQEWNDVISRNDLVVIDTRNDYEFDLGTFENAINPNTKNFREFPQYMEDHFGASKKSVAMFCTGGIRCEKASSYLIQQGYDHVYNLKGGILKYLEVVPEDQSMWKGDCFVFDQRVTVKHGLEVGNCTLCRGCRHPLTAEDRTRPDYKEDIHCRYCINTLTKEKEEKATQRHIQMELAAKRNEKHLGYVHNPQQKKQKSGPMTDAEKVTEESQGVQQSISTA